MANRSEKPEAGLCLGASESRSRRRLLGPAECRSMESLRVTVQCPWSGCQNEISVYRSQIFWGLTSRNRSTRKCVFCDYHRALVHRLAGDSACMNGFGRVFANPSRDYATRIPQSLALRIVLFVNAKERCADCGRTLNFSDHKKDWRIDHRLPIYKGGKTTLANLVPLCLDCHKSKTRIEIQETRRLRPNTSIRDWMTHRQKDESITALKKEIADLKREIECLKKQLRERDNGKARPANQVDFARGISAAG